LLELIELSSEVNRKYVFVANYDSGTALLRSPMELGKSDPNSEVTALATLISHTVIIIISDYHRS